VELSWIDLDQRHDAAIGSFQKSLEVKVASRDFALQTLKPIGGSSGWPLLKGLSFCFRLRD
jgi:hypothetical protein